jgi:hypothetical protein
MLVARDSLSLIDLHRRPEQFVLSFSLTILVFSSPRLQCQLEYSASFSSLDLNLQSRSCIPAL